MTTTNPDATTRTVLDQSDDLLYVARTLCAVASRAANLPRGRLDRYTHADENGSPVLAAARAACLARGYTEDGLAVAGVIYPVANKAEVEPVAWAVVVGEDMANAIHFTADHEEAQGEYDERVKGGFESIYNLVPLYATPPATAVPEMKNAFMTLESNAGMVGRNIVLKFNQREDAYAVHDFLLKVTGAAYNTPPATAGASTAFMPTVLTDERIAFEAAMPVHHPRDRNMPDGSYNSPFLHPAWLGWQARSKVAAQAGRVSSVPSDVASVPSAVAVPEDLVQDAARYRWLRAQENDRSPCFDWMMGSENVLKTLEKLDSAIDAEMSEFAAPSPAKESK